MSRLPVSVHAIILTGRTAVFYFFFLFSLQVTSLFGQENEPESNSLASLSPGEYKKLSLEELMDIQVTSVSRTPQKLSEVASAIQVITSEDIRRSAFSRLPEALRLAPNLMVAQSHSHNWGITARGFNGAPLVNSTLANKLLVMIDGRSIYTPLFGGVFWDVQNVLLEDVDRIEVVSGPGGSMWGANAVNGVISIASKNARETQGLYATAATGTFLQNHLGLRYGARLGDRLFMRIYGQRFDQEGTESLDGEDTMDQWSMTQGGFRADYFASDASTLTVQGDLYGGKEDAQLGDVVDGQNLLAHWIHTLSEASSLNLQMYYDRTWRRFPATGFNEELQTYDVDFQHNLRVGSSHNISWGLGYRLMNDKINNENEAGLIFVPADRKMPLYEAFVQDQLSMLDDQLQLTIGTKLLHNIFTDFEFQPSLRLAFLPNRSNTAWAAVSRAVRTPSRLDVDIVSPTIAGRTGQFESENVLAWELGYRWEPVDKVSLSLATFINRYSDLRSWNANADSPPAFFFENDLSAHSTGVEVSGNFYASEKWRIRAGYTYLYSKFDLLNTLVQPFSVEFEAADPRNQFVFQSILDLFKNFQLDIHGRYVHMLEPTILSPAVPTYVTFDVRAAYQFKNITISINGQNLADNEHAEFGSSQIPRGVYGRITCRF